MGHCGLRWGAAGRYGVLWGTAGCYGAQRGAMGRSGAAPGEGVPRVVHNAVEVVRLPQRLHLVGLHLEEVVLLACRGRRASERGRKRRSVPPEAALTGLDVVADDGHVVVAVGPRVLVPEADHVTQLVHHDAELIAVLPDGNGLRAPPAAPHLGAAPGGGGGEGGGQPGLGGQKLFSNLLVSQ